MTNSGLQEINGEIGENKTANILLEDGLFWVIRKPLPDLQGRDFLLQIAPSSEEIDKWRRPPEVLGVVQSKFITGSNEVIIPQMHICDNVGARTEYFLFIHTVDVTFFFTAQQIIDEQEFRLRDEKYVFSLAGGRKYEKYKNLEPKNIRETILKGMRQATSERNTPFVEFFLKNYLSNGMTSYKISANERIIDTGNSLYKISHSDLSTNVSEINKSTGVKRGVLATLPQKEGSMGFNTSTETPYTTGDTL